MVLSASGFVQETATVSSYSASRWFEGNIDAPMGSEIAKFCFERRVFCFLQLQDGRILTGHSDGTLQVSDMLSLDFCRAGEVIIRAHPFPVDAIVQLRDGRVVSSSSFSIYMKLWDMDSLTCLKRIEMPELSLMSIHNVRSLVELSDGTLLRKKIDFHPQLGHGPLITTLSVWDLATGLCASSIILPKEYIELGGNILPLRNCGQWQCCCWGRQANAVLLLAFRPTMEECHRDLTGHSAGVSCVLQLEDGRLVSGSLDLTVKVWDVASGLCLATLSGHRSAVDSLTVLHSPLRIISVDDHGTVRIWDAATYSCLSEHSMISLRNMDRLDTMLAAHSIFLRNSIFLRSVLADGRILSVETMPRSLILWTPDPSRQQYISSPIIGFPQIVEVQPLSGADDSGFVLIQEEIDTHVSVFSVCSFTTMQSQRWIRRRGWLLLVHSYRAAARNASPHLLLSPAFEQLINFFQRDDSGDATRYVLVKMIAQML